MYRIYIILHFDVIVNTYNAVIFKFLIKVVLKISESRKPLTDYERNIKIRLIEINKTQKWLIKEVKKLLPNKYLDCSNLHKIMAGKIKSPDIVAAINQVLEISDERTGD